MKDLLTISCHYNKSLILCHFVVKETVEKRTRYLVVIMDCVSVWFKLRVKNKFVLIYF